MLILFRYANDSDGTWGVLLLQIIELILRYLSGAQ